MLREQAEEILCCLLESAKPLRSFPIRILPTSRNQRDKNIRYAFGELYRLGSGSNIARKIASFLLCNQFRKRVSPVYVAEFTKATESGFSA